MVPDPLIAVAEVQPAVHTTDEGANLPAPTIHQEHVADDVFSPEQQHMVAAFLAVQTGLGLLHHIVAEATPSPKEEMPEPKRKAMNEPEEEA